MEETSTQQRDTAPLDDGHRDFQRRRRSWVIAGLATIVTIVAVAVIAWLLSGEDEPTARTPVDSNADAVAVSFMETTHAYDLDRAVGMLAEDAEIVDAADVADWRNGLAWEEAAGFTLAELSCREGQTTSSGTSVHCSYALHGLGSKQLGRGPYGGGTADLTVLDGKITSIEENWPFIENGFSAEMWEPFEAWIARHHLADHTVMYGESLTKAESARSLRLWEMYIAEYVATQR